MGADGGRRPGQGTGRLLLDELVSLASARGFYAVLGRILGGHEASIALHCAGGFEIIGFGQPVGRKFGRWLDVTPMQGAVRRVSRSNHLTN